MNLKNVNMEKIRDLLKRGGAIMGCSLILASSLTGCVNISSYNDESYELEEGDTNISTWHGVITDDDIRKLPSTIETLNLDKCMYVHDLSSLPAICPNIKKISLNSCSSIVDLSFIMLFPNLESVELNDMSGISVELLEYLEEKGIEYHITEDDIEASRRVEEIIEEIITDDMSDEQKIRAVCLYVSKNCKYRITSRYESNDDPLTTTLLTEKGVCAGIAYTTNVLLRKAGIESYELTSQNHAWNLIGKDGKYYYVDVTNLGAPILPKFIAHPLIEYFGFSDGYMVSPTSTVFTAMENYDDRDKVLIPKSLVEEIRRGEEEKNLFEKYGSNVPAHIIEALIVLIGISGGIKLASHVIDKVRRR